MVAVSLKKKLYTIKLQITRPIILLSMTTHIFYTEQQAITTRLTNVLPLCGIDATRGWKYFSGGQIDTIISDTH